MAKKEIDKKKKEKPAVNPDLDGFDIKINSFGELKSSYSIDKINEFLNQNVEDKKLIHRDDYDEIKSHKKKRKRKKP